MIIRENRDTSGVIEEILVVRGQKVTLGCTAVDENAERFRNIKHTDDIQTVRWFHEDKEVSDDK